MVQKQKKIYLISVTLITAVFTLSSCGKILELTSKEALKRVQDLEVKPVVDVTKERDRALSKSDQERIKASLAKSLKVSKNEKSKNIESEVSKKTNLKEKVSSGAIGKRAIKTIYTKPKKGFKFSFVQGKLGLWKSPWRKSSGLLSVRF